VYNVGGVVKSVFPSLWANLQSLKRLCGTPI